MGNQVYNSLVDPDEDTDFITLLGRIRFGSAKHLGEDPNGQWQLRVTDEKPLLSGLLNSWSITVYGHQSGSAVETPSGSCVEALGSVTQEISLTGTWGEQCESSQREGSYARFYPLALPYETEVQIDLASEHDAYLYLLEGAPGSRQVLQENDDIDSDNHDSRITATLGAGDYTIEATTFSPGVTGKFGLRVVPQAEIPPHCRGTLVVSSSQTSRRGIWSEACDSVNREGSYAYYYQFTLEEQTEVQIDVSSEQDTYLYLLEGAPESGQVLQENDDIDSDNHHSRITATLGAGDYTIEVSTYLPGETGLFTLSIVPVVGDDGCAEDLGPLDDELSRDGAWSEDCSSIHRSGSYARFYAFTLEQQTAIQVDLVSSSDPYVFLLEGPLRTGRILGQNDDIVDGINRNSRIIADLPAGDYTVEATTFGSGTIGRFALTIARYSEEGGDE